MILEKITLQNFGLFKGRQVLDVSSRSQDRPVVLLGGYNGTGKTTILEALQVGLYGKLASTPRRYGRAYEDYLRQLIHNKAAPEENTAVEVKFRFTEGGKERSYILKRMWTTENGKIDESLDIKVDGVADLSLSETWYDQVERFMPARLRELFFFDGERIEALADPNESSKILATGIHALLGVDILDQLRSDLKVISRRHCKKMKSATDKEKIDALESSLKSVNTERQQLVDQRARLKNDLDRKQKKLREAEALYRERGGILLEQREEIEQRRAETNRLLEMQTKELIEIAAGPLPFLLVGELLTGIQEQIHTEQSSERAEVFLQEIRERDFRLLKYLEDENAAKKLLISIKNFFEKEYQNSQSHLTSERYLGLTFHDAHHLEILISSILQQEQDRAQRLLAEHEKLTNELDTLDSKLESVPEESKLQDVFERVETAQKQCQTLDTKIADVERNIHEVNASRDRIVQKLEKILRSEKEKELEAEEFMRIVEYADHTSETIENFQKEIVKQNIKRLEAIILEGYRHLLRKQTLVQRVAIDVESYNLVLFNREGLKIPPEHLSAGERQLLALSILWGLAKASGRPLPVVIDTPLSRLDATHRTNLVERYFPYASHQVLLLSTDEEIDEKYYKKLKPKINRAYRLDHDEVLGGTAIQPGYFWEA